MNNSSLRLSVNIDLAKIDENGVSNSNYRVITLTDSTDYAALGVPLSQLSGYFIVTDPVGNIIHQGDFTTPDIVQNVDTSFDGVEVPLDAYNNPVNGTYKFQMFVKRVIGESTVFYNTAVSDFTVCVNSCKSSTKAEIEINFDCSVSTATGYDRTKYKSNASVTRLLTMSPPVASKYIDGSTATDFVSSSNTVYSNALWTQLWQLLLRAVVTEVTLSGFATYTLVFSLEERTTGEAACAINLCGLYSCLDKKLLQLEKEGSRKGGISNNLAIADEFVQITMLFERLEVARQCGKYQAAQNAYNALKEHLSCDCGCGDSGMPEYVYPLVAPPSNDVVVQGSTYIAVTSNTVGNTTTYTVALSSTLSNLISLVKTYGIQSTDGSINVSSTTVGTSVLFDITVDTDVVDTALGAKIDSKCVGGDDLTEIVQNLVDKACEGGLPPVAEPDTAATTENVEVSVLVTLNDFYTSNVEVTIETPPANGTAVVGDDNKTITYTPDEDWTGTDVLTYTITDAAGQTSSATLTIVVNPIAGVGCTIITGQFIANISLQAGLLQLVLTNITQYLTNVPTSNDYVVEVRNSSNVVLETYNVSGNNTNVPQLFTIPDSPLSTWDNILITQTVVSENNVGDTCGTSIVTNNYTIPNITNSIFAGVTVSCLGVTNADPDVAIMQALVNKACAALSAVSTENGISGNGTSGNKVRLGGTLNQNTTLDGAYDLAMTLQLLDIKRKLTTYIGGKSLTFAEDTITQDTIPATGESHFSYQSRKNIFFDNVTYDFNTRNIQIDNTFNELTIGGDSAVLQNALDNASGQNIYTIINAFFGNKIDANNVSIDTESLVNIFSDGIFANSQLGTVNVDSYYHLYLRDTDAGSPGTYIIPTQAYAIFQEGADDDSFFYGLVTFDQAIVVPSDERVKDVLGSYGKGLSAIKKLKVVKYKRKEGYGDSTEERVGVIAQQVEEVIPEAISTGSNPKYKDLEDFKTVNESALLYTAINAIQELNAKVEKLEKELKELKKG